jgi:hypothetical protein
MSLFTKVLFSQSDFTLFHHPTVWGEKYPRGFLYTRGEINYGRASVYRKYTINKDTRTQTLFIFYKIQILIPMYNCALHSLLLGRSDLGDSGLLSPG